MTTTSSASGTSSAADIFAAISKSGTSSTAKSTSIADDMSTKFLKLLMTQIKNQDPLNPLDNAQVTSQLAQINTVNGIAQLNDSLTKLVDVYNNAQALQAAGVIGKHVLVAGSQIKLSSGVAAAGFKLDAAADSVTVKILDSFGNVVRSQDLGAQPAGNTTFAWDGNNNAGTVVADGTYKLTVSASMGGKAVGATALQVGTVNAVGRSGSGFVLDLGNGGEVAFADVQEIF